MNTIILESFHEIRKDMNYYHNLQTAKHMKQADIILSKTKIKAKIAEANNHVKTIDNNNKNMAKKKKQTEEELGKRSEIAKNFLIIIEDLNLEQEGKSRPEDKYSKQGPDNIFEKKDKGDDDYDDDYSEEGERVQIETDDVKAKRNEWKAREDKIDKNVGVITDLLCDIEAMAKDQNEAMKDLGKLHVQANKEVNKVMKTTKSQNAKLQEMLKSYRKPRKCCLDQCLFIFLLGMIGIIVNMLR